MRWNSLWKMSSRPAVPAATSPLPAPSLALACDPSHVPLLLHALLEAVQLRRRLISHASDPIAHDSAVWVEDSLQQALRDVDTYGLALTDVDRQGQGEWSNELLRALYGPDVAHQMLRAYLALASHDHTLDD